MSNTRKRSVSTPIASGVPHPRRCFVLDHVSCTAHVGSLLTSLQGSFRSARASSLAGDRALYPMTHAPELSAHTQRRALRCVPRCYVGLQTSSWTREAVPRVRCSKTPSHETPTCASICKKGTPSNPSIEQREGPNGHCEGPLFLIIKLIIKLIRTDQNHLPEPLISQAFQRCGNWAGIPATSSKVSRFSLLAGAGLPSRPPRP